MTWSLDPFWVTTMATPMSSQGDWVRRELHSRVLVLIGCFQLINCSIFFTFRYEMVAFEFIVVKVYICIFAYLCICIFVYLCICVFVYLCIWIFVYLYIWKCICKSIYLQLDCWCASAHVIKWICEQFQFYLLNSEWGKIEFAFISRNLLYFHLLCNGICLRQQKFYFHRFF